MTGGLTRGPPYDRTTSGQLSDSLTISDLKPNIGLAWYFFIEMFDHFRAFFLVVFALHPLLYVAPFTIAYKYVGVAVPSVVFSERDAFALLRRRLISASLPRTAGNRCLRAL